MPIDFDGDLQAMFSERDFATRASFRLASGAQGEISGFFDNPQALAGLGEVGLIEARPVFTVRTGTLPEGIAEGDELTVSARRYVLAVDPVDDGAGVSVLTLEAGP